MITAADLARKLELSRARVTQLVKGGDLDGCYRGEGRQRRFDLVKSAKALGKRLDPGQMMGNGKGTKSAIDAITAKTGAKQKAAPEGVLPPTDLDRYQMARTLQAEEQARRLRLNNEVEAGVYVLASELDQQVARALSQEIAGFEVFLKDACVQLTDTPAAARDMKVNLLALWREYRGDRADAAQAEADAAELTEAERAGDI